MAREALKLVALADMYGVPSLLLGAVKLDQWFMWLGTADGEELKVVARWILHDCEGVVLAWDIHLFELVLLEDDF